MTHKIFLAMAGLAVGGITGFIIGSKVNERRTMNNNFIDISELEVLCNKNQDDCTLCPMFDPDTDMCRLHTEIPANWDNNYIRQVVKGGNNGNKTEA